MIKRKLQAVINRFSDDKAHIKRALKDWYNEREEVDLGQMFDSNGDEVVNVETYHIDLKIDRAEGYVEGLDEAIKKLEMLKESIKND
tara:strand:+ start:3447 stop:3707 length:261 start_codon:yes stop_codon:yes gene_type:complete